jgi:atypical dual specificity phosphatase
MPKRFSWILPNKLAVGSFPHETSSIFKLRREGISSVLSLTEEAEIKIPSDLQHNFVWERVGIPDGYTGGVPSVEQFAQALSVLGRWDKKGHVMFVHCLAGVGRSASVCSLFVAHQKELSLEDAILYVQSQHKYAAPDNHQRQVMQDYLNSLPQT